MLDFNLAVKLQKNDNFIVKLKKKCIFGKMINFCVNLKK